MTDRISREPVVLGALQDAYLRGLHVTVHDLTTARCGLQTVRRHLRRLRRLGVVESQPTPRRSPEGKTVGGRGLLAYRLTENVGVEYAAAWARPEDAHAPVPDA